MQSHRSPCLKGALVLALHENFVPKGFKIQMCNKKGTTKNEKKKVVVPTPTCDMKEKIFTNKNTRTLTCLRKSDIKNKNVA